MTMETGTDGDRTVFINQFIVIVNVQFWDSFQTKCDATQKEKTFMLSSYWSPWASPLS